MRAFAKHLSHKQAGYTCARQALAERCKQAGSRSWMCVVLGGTLPKVRLHEGVQDFKGGKFVTPLTSGMAGKGKKGSAVYAQTGWGLEPLP